MLLWTSHGERRQSARLAVVAGREGARRDAQLLKGWGNLARYRDDAEIFCEGDPADYVYQVASGAVRLVRLMSDGRRQINSFYFAGDIFGLDADKVHRFSAEAIGRSEILLIKRSVFLRELRRDAELMDELWTQTTAELRRAQEHMITLGRKSAYERVADFLIDVSTPLFHSGAVELPMSRTDIADYLGLTIETVSRMLTRLQRNGVISLTSSRRVLLRDRSALAETSDRLVA
jgi:CRP/FNR family nitrogen fixation transcriptional regulator